MALLSRPNLCRALVLALVAATSGLAGCGRRGDLEAPSTTAAAPAQAGQPAKAAETPPPPDRPFVLDPLLR